MHPIRIFVPALAVLILAGVEGVAAQPAARPVEELRCIYDGLADPIRDQVGEKFWTLDASGSASRLIGAAAGQCADRHGWNADTLAQAGLYAYALAAVRYARARLAGMGVDVGRWDSLYDATPPERRTLRADEGGIAAFSPIITEAVDGDPVARRIPDSRTRAALLFTMRATIERAERRWVAPPPPPPRR